MFSLKQTWSIYTFWLDHIFVARLGLMHRAILHAWRLEVIGKIPPPNSETHCDGAHKHWGTFKVAILTSQSDSATFGWMCLNPSPSAAVRGRKEWGRALDQSTLGIICSRQSGRRQPLKFVDDQNQTSSQDGSWNIKFICRQRCPPIWLLRQDHAQLLSRSVNTQRRSITVSDGPWNVKGRGHSEEDSRFWARWQKFRKIH